MLAPQTQEENTMSIVEQVNGKHNLLSEIADTIMPFFIEQGKEQDFLDNESIREMSILYSEGFLNMENGVSSVTDKFKQFLKEVDGLKLKVTGMNLRHGYNTSISFYVKTGYSDDERRTEVSFHSGDHYLRIYSDNVLNKIIVYRHLNELFEGAFDHMDLPRNKRRMTASVSGKRLMEIYEVAIKDSDAVRNWSYRNLRDSTVGYFMFKYLKLDVPISIVHPSIEDKASKYIEYHKKQNNYGRSGRESYFKTGRLYDIPFYAKLGLLLNNYNNKEYITGWEGSDLSKTSLIETANKMGLANWKDGVMELTCQDTAKAAFESFRKEFIEYFSAGRWRIKEYNLNYCSFRVEYLAPDSTNGESEFEILFSTNNTGASLMKLFEMFSVTDTLVTSLCKTLSCDMVSELAMQLFQGKYNDTNGNLRDIIGLMSEKIEQKAKQEEEQSKLL